MISRTEIFFLLVRHLESYDAMFGGRNPLVIQPRRLVKSCVTRDVCHILCHVICQLLGVINITFKTSLSSANPTKIRIRLYYWRRAG